MKYAIALIVAIGAAATAQGTFGTKAHADAISHCLRGFTASMCSWHGDNVRAAQKEREKQKSVARVKGVR